MLMCYNSECRLSTMSREKTHEHLTEYHRAYHLSFVWE